MNSDPVRGRDWREHPVIASPRGVYQTPAPRPSAESPLSAPRIHIIGIGSDGMAGLTARSRELLTSAEVVYGPAALR